MEIGLLILLFSVSAYSMLAKKLSTTIITAPMVFLGIGFAVSQAGLINIGDAHETVYLIAEISLVVLLFLDASQINLRRLKRQNTWPLKNAIDRFAVEYFDWYRLCLFILPTVALGNASPSCGNFSTD